MLCKLVKASHFLSLGRRGGGRDRRGDDRFNHLLKGGLNGLHHVLQVWAVELQFRVVELLREHIV